MGKGRVRDFFPGGNTSVGFFSFYEYIIPQDANRIMVIKGGPGVGKSSFMKKLAGAMIDQGYDAELHHCSSDNNSLDGVVFPQLKVALIDGTSPHIVDPKNPGAVDEIIHLGDYWDEAGIRKHKDAIIKTNQHISRTFGRAYQFLKAAKAIHDDLESLVTLHLNFGAANQKTAELIAMVLKDRPLSSKVGSLRKLFGSAITPDGFKNYLETVLSPANRVFLVSGEAGSGKSTMIRKLAEAAVERGYDCEAFYCAFDPSKMEHLVIPELQTAVSTDVEPHRALVNPSITIPVDMNRCLDDTYRGNLEAIREDDRQIKASLFERAISCLHDAKAAHDEMEQYYIPYMDFDAIAKLRERTLKRILAYTAV